MDSRHPTRCRRSASPASGALPRPSPRGRRRSASWSGAVPRRWGSRSPSRSRSGPRLPGPTWARRASSPRKGVRGGRKVPNRLACSPLPLVSAALPSPLPTKLNLGCGQFPLSGFLNVDVEKHAKADVYLDLDDLRNYELFPSCHFEIIVMDHVLEHLDDVFGVLIAVHRLLKPGGRLEIRVPHFSRGITHPEHRHGFDVTFPEYMRPGFQGGYIGVPLELDSMRLDYMIRWDLKGVAVRSWQLPILKAMNGLVSWLANM